MSRTAEITVAVDIDDDNLPRAIRWQATDSPFGTPRMCQALMMSVWDTDENATAAIDLWTPEITVADMNRHFYQTIHKLADTYGRATNNQDVADLVHDFGERFGEMVGLN